MNQLLTNKLINFGVIGYITVILFNGILMHFGLTYPFLEAIRPILPELFLLFSLFGWILNNKFVSYDFFLVIIFFSITMLFSYENFSVNAFLITMRNVIIPFAFMLLISTTNSNKREFNNFLNMLFWIFAIFVITGSFFSIVQQLKGWNWMSTYFQGYASWGDENGKVRVVMSSYGTLRTLGTTGDSSTFGLYSSLSIILFLFKEKKFYLFKLILCILALISIINSGNKTSLLLYVFIIFYYILTIIFKNNIKIMDRIVLFMVIITIFISLFFTFNASSDSFYYTMNMRFKIWSEIFTYENMLNLIFPHTIFGFSAMGDTGGVTTIWDNSYLFILFSFGIIGFLIFAYIFRNLIKIMIKNNIVKVLVYILLLSMFSTNIFTGRNIAGFAIIFIGILYANRRNLIYEK